MSVVDDKKSILGEVFEELREIRSIMHPTMHMAYRSHEGEFLRTLSLVLENVDSNSYKDFLVNINPITLTIFYNNVKEFVTEFSKYTLMDTKKRMDEMGNTSGTGTSVSTSMLVFKSSKPPRFEADGKIARDMTPRLYSKTELEDLHTYMEYQVNSNVDTLFIEFSSMATDLFAMGDMNSVVLDMINHFKTGKGADYVNPTLVEKVKNHEKTQIFIKDMTEAIKIALSLNGGDLKKLKYERDNDICDYVQNNISFPVYNKLSDIFGGLTMCLNGIWGCNATIENYTFDGNNYSGILKFYIYDHFGLDVDDLTNSYLGSQFGDLAGFRAWFVLQYYEDFNGDYKPFVTKIEIEVPFKGKLHE